ncbi:alpha-L-rhamnosidase C-terminal domain-containing protein [Rhodoluna sp.]|uniref:alpha-L-rhamnosidase C-terminal domain-containing protein n=1 Tax=Rhodoluna sp. TaxID=1969481 RepID=UPI00345640F5
MGADFDWQVQPFVGGGVTWAKASHQTLGGPIATSWSVTHSDFTLEVTVPAGTTAKVVMPDGEVHLI